MGKITLYDIPVTRNKFDKKYRMEQSRINNKWINDIVYSFYNQRPPKPYEKAKVKITIYFKTNRRRDKENYMLKFFCDGLVTGKIIKDDRQEVIGLPEIELKWDPKNPRTIIEVWEDTNAEK